MKRIKLATVALISFIVLAGCNNTEELVDYAEMSFSGMDGYGEAMYDLDYDSLYSKLTEEENFEAEEELMHSGDAIELSVDQGNDLSNDDVVNLSIDVKSDDMKYFVGGEKEFTVEGLEEPTEVTTEEVEKGIVVNFLGASGQGKAQIDNTLSSPLNSVEFSIENDGTLKNGDKPEIILADDSDQHLHNEGYILEDNFNPTVEVKGLDVVAEKAEDIKNLKDIKRMIDEEVNRQYNNSDDSFSFVTYETEKQDLMYRQFKELDSDDESDNYYNNDKNSNGSLIGIYSVKEFSDEEKNDLEKEYTAIVGFTNIIINEDNETNVSKMEDFKEVKDDTYSLESIIQLYEGNGYTKLKNEDD